jgi:mannose-6-phosphate isomerase-like protein (cupin superfamily)
MSPIWNVHQLAAAQSKAYDEFLRIPTMSIGLYKLSAGGVDSQSPHTEDEAYYVVSGTAHVEIEDHTYPVKPGDVIFVAANAPHRFRDFADDFVVLVVFAPAEYTNK